MYDSDKQKIEQGKRLREFRDYLDVKQGVFAAAIGLKQGSYSDIERGRNFISSSLLQNIVENYNLNANWLLTGIGEMMIKKTDYHVTGSTGNSVQVFNDPVQVTRLTRGKNVFVPIEARAGYMQEWTQEQLEETIVYVDIPGVRGDARTFELNGVSMLPILEDGDFIVCTPVDRKEEIKDGVIYVIITRESGISAKYLKPTQDGILMISANDALYKPYIVPYEDIREIWEAKMKITKSFGSVLPYDYTNQMLPRIERIEQYLSKSHPDFDHQ